MLCYAFNANERNREDRERERQKSQKHTTFYPIKFDDAMNALTLFVQKESKRKREKNEITEEKKTKKETRESYAKVVISNE